MNSQSNLVPLKNTDKVQLSKFQVATALQNLRRGPLDHKRFNQALRRFREFGKELMREPAVAAPLIRCIELHAAFLSNSGQHDSAGKVYGVMRQIFLDIPTVVAQAYADHFNLKSTYYLNLYNMEMDGVHLFNEAMKMPDAKSAAIAFQDAGEKLLKAGRIRPAIKAFEHAEQALDYSRFSAFMANFNLNYNWQNAKEVDGNVWNVSSKLETAYGLELSQNLSVSYALKKHFDLSDGFFEQMPYEMSALHSFVIDQMNWNALEN